MDCSAESSRPSPATPSHTPTTPRSSIVALTSTVLGTQEAIDGPPATGHDPEGPLEPADLTVRRTFPSGESNNGPSGAIVSTARDVAVFAAELFRGEPLEAPTMSEMLDFETSLDLAGADEWHARGLGVLRESANTEYGLTWGHNGIVKCFTAAVRYYPAYDIAVAVLVNGTGIDGGAQATEELLALELIHEQPPIDPDRGRGRCVQDVYTIRPDGSGLSNVTTETRTEWSVAWSPDSRRLMFATAFDNNDLYLIDRDSSGLEQVTDAPGVDGPASWSPDGERIVFERDRSGERVLYTAAADGSGADVLTDGRLASWSPLGDTIAYSRPGPDGNLDLWLIDDDGTNAHPLVVEDGDDLWASWSPDRQRSPSPSTGRWRSSTSTPEQSPPSRSTAT